MPPKFGEKCDSAYPAVYEIQREADLIFNFNLIFQIYIKCYKNIFIYKYTYSFEIP